MAIVFGSSTHLHRHLLPTITSSSNGGIGGERKRLPPMFISSNPSHINLHSLSSLYCACNHSPHRFPSSSPVDDVDPSKLAVAVAVAHSAVVVSVFARLDGGGGEREKGLFGRILPAAVRVAPGNADLVIPSLRRMGIGRMILQRIMRILYNKGIYDVSALCSEEERLFFRACGFGDDTLGSSTMMYAKEVSGNFDDAELVTRAGRKLLIPPPSRPPLIPQ